MLPSLSPTLSVHVTAPLSGGGGVVLGAPNLPTALALADGYIRSVNWDTREDRPCVRIEIWRLCEKCNGEGYVRTKRPRFGYPACKACKGKGIAEVLFDRYMRDSDRFYVTPSTEAPLLRGDTK